ncbi:MAG: phosphotransferase [Bacteroidales bacterium]
MNPGDKIKGIKKSLKDIFNLEVQKIEELVGYANDNYKVIDKSGANYILKEYLNTAANFDLYNSESTIVNQLAEMFPDRFQVPVKTIDGKYLTLSKDEKSLFRLLSWIDGRFLKEVAHTPELFKSFGCFLSQMDRELLKLDSPVIRARNIEWDLQHIFDRRKKTKFISDPALRKLVEYYFIQFKEYLLPELPGLRKSIIHNDGNDWNVLVQDGKVSGMIDFGDMVYAPLIQELAVAITYAVFEKDDPLMWAGFIISGYNESLPLEE